MRFIVEGHIAGTFRVRDTSVQPVDSVRENGRGVLSAGPVVTVAASREGAERWARVFNAGGGRESFRIA